MESSENISTVESKIPIEKSVIEKGIAVGLARVERLCNGADGTRRLEYHIVRLSMPFVGVA